MILSTILLQILLSHGAPDASRPFATELASAIEDEAPDTYHAVLVAVWASNEDTRVRKCAVGDGGRALGPLQLQGSNLYTACDAHRAVREWLRRGSLSQAHCGGLEELASGSCGRGHRLVAARMAEVDRWLYTIGWEATP
jgi:hypothetical protein